MFFMVICISRGYSIDNQHFTRKNIFDELVERGNPGMNGLVLEGLY
jgi:hypothetical protein